MVVVLWITCQGRVLVACPANLEVFPAEAPPLDVFAALVTGIVGISPPVMRGAEGTASGRCTLLWLLLLEGGLVLDDSVSRVVGGDQGSVGQGRDHGILALDLLQKDGMVRSVGVSVEAEPVVSAGPASLVAVVVGRSLHARVARQGEAVGRDRPAVVSERGRGAMVMVEAGLHRGRVGEWRVRQWLRRKLGVSLEGRVRSLMMVDLG